MKTQKHTHTITSTLLILIIITLFSFNVNANTELIDSDGDGVIDSKDNCPDTNPAEGLPIIRKHPEFLGCSCSQIYIKLEKEYCLDAYCFPGKPFETINRATSRRPLPCGPSKCEGTTLHEYKLINPIKCINGAEQPHDCEEIITENSERCNIINTNIIDEQTETKTIYDLITDTYFKENTYSNILNSKNSEEIQRINENIKNQVMIIRKTTNTERTINNNTILVSDVEIKLTPKKYTQIKNLVVLEIIKEDLQDLNLVIRDHELFDETNQIITWKIPLLDKEKTLTYRITPGKELEQELILQGEVTSTIFTHLVVPVMLILLVFLIVILEIMKIKEKNKIFKKE